MLSDVVPIFVKGIIQNICGAQFEIQFNSSLYIKHLLRSKLSRGALQKSRALTPNKQESQGKTTFNRKKP